MSLYGPPVLRLVDAEELVDLGEHLGAEGEGAGEGAAAQLPVPILLADGAVPAISVHLEPSTLNFPFEPIPV